MLEDDTVGGPADSETAELSLPGPTVVDDATSEEVEGNVDAFEILEEVFCAS